MAHTNSIFKEDSKTHMDIYGFIVEELKPIYSRNRSFYGKANVVTHADGTVTLFSYTTAVCEIDPTGAFHRTWGGYSATTMKHVNDFMIQRGFGGCGVDRWRSMPVEDARHWFMGFTANYTVSYY